MPWELHPEPDADERAVLLAAAEDALAPQVEAESAWWRSGQADLDGGAPAKQAWRDSGVVEP
jgi:hypothetical protein